MTQTQTATTHFTAVGRVIVTVSDQDKAIEFYCNTLGFEKLSDTPYGNGDRWIEVAPAGALTAISLVLPMGENQPGGQTGIVLFTTDVDADHAVLQARGVDVDAEIMRGGGPVPPMFWFRDRDGNILLVVEPQLP